MISINNEKFCFSKIIQFTEILLYTLAVVGQLKNYKFVLRALQKKDFDFLQFIISIISIFFYLKNYMPKYCIIDIIHR